MRKAKQNKLTFALKEINERPRKNIKLEKPEEISNQTFECRPLGDG